MLLAAIAALTLSAQAAEIPSETTALEQVSAAMASGEVSTPAFRAAVSIVLSDAASGDAESMNYAGVLMQRGLATSERSAEDWYRAAIGSGDKATSEAAAINLALMLYVTEGRASEARSLLEAIESPEQHLLPMVHGYLGYDYLTGVGGDADQEQGRAFLNSAVAFGFSNAFILERYAEFWLNPPEGVERRPDRADELFRRAIDAGSVNAAWRLGMLFLDIGRPETEAYRLVSWAADQGDTQAMISRGVMLALGQGVEANPVEARDWYLRAARAGSAHAFRSLGGMWARGEGGDTNIALGFALLDMAAAAGDELAVQVVERLAEEGVARPSEADIGQAREAFLAAEDLSADGFY